MNGDGCDASPEGSCSLCRDEAVPARVLTIDAHAGAAEVEIDGERRSVALDLIEGVLPGDTILVHQGFALQRVEQG